MTRLTLTLAALLAAATLRAGDTPVPADALVVVQFNGRGPVADHVAQFLAAVQPDAAKAFPAQLKKFFDELAPGRDLGAVPPGERVVGVAFTFDGWNSPTPPWVWLVPVADAATFRKRLLTDDERGDFEAGKAGVSRAGGWFLVNRPGFVAVSASEDAAKAFHASKALLTPERLGPVHAVVNDADASVYVNVANVNKQYGLAAQLALTVIKSSIGGLSKGFDERQQEVVELVFSGLSTAMPDVRDFALGLSLGAEGVTLRTELAFTPGSPTAKQFAADKPTTLDELATLPAGRATYTASKWGPAAAAILRRLTREYESPGGDDRAADAVRRYEEALRAAGVQVGAGRGAEGGLLLATAEPAKLTAAHAKLIRAMPRGGFSRNVLLAEKPGLREAALEAHGFTLYRAELNLDVAAGVAGIRDPNLRQATLESVRRLVNEKTVLWFGDDGKRYAQVEAATPEAAANQLGALLADGDRVGANAAFGATRQRLPREASFVLLAEAGPAMTLLADYARSVAGALPAVPGFEVPEFRTLKDPPLSFVGVVATAQEARLSLTVVVPAAAAKVAVDSTVIPAP